MQRKIAMKVISYSVLLNDNELPELVPDKPRLWGGDAEQFQAPGDVVLMLNQVFELYRQAEEHLYMVALNHRLHPIGVFEVFHGTNCNCCANPREIFLRAALIGAARIVIAHNHPGGSIVPSHDDDVTTVKVSEAGMILGIELVDHIIVSRQGFFSYKENARLDEIEEKLKNERRNYEKI